MLNQSQRSFDSTRKTPFLHPIIDTTGSIVHKYHKSRFPSVDATVYKSSKLQDSNKNISTSLMNKLHSLQGSMKKIGRTSLALNLNQEIGNSDKVRKEYLVGLSNKIKMKTNVLPTGSSQRKIKNSLYKKSLDLNLEEVSSFQKTQSSILSTTYSKTHRSKFNKNMPSYILENRIKILLAIHMKEPYLVLEYLFENMAASIQLENLDFLCETMSLIGEFYLLGNDIQNAVYSFHNLSNLADMTGKRQIKIKSYLNLSACCKKLKKYDFSRKFLKKALQYSWHFKQDSRELLIYDELGLINYLLGDLYRAKYYHERFMNNQKESDSSPCKFASEEILLKVFEYTKIESHSINSIPLSPSHLTTLILTRLGLNKEWNEKTNSPLFKKKEVEESKENVTFFFKKKLGELNIPTVRFFTNLDVEIQLDTIFQSKEFQYEVSSPRYPCDENQGFFNSTKTRLKKINREQIHLISNKTLDRLEFLKKKPKVNIIEDPMKKKIPLEEKINYRMKENWSEFNLDKKLRAFISVRKNDTNEKGYFCLYNHLTPNRNLVGYNYDFSSYGNVEKINKYYSKIYEYGNSPKNININIKTET